MRYNLIMNKAIVMLGAATLIVAGCSSPCDEKEESAPTTQPPFLAVYTLQITDHQFPPDTSCGRQLATMLIPCDRP